MSMTNMCDKKFFTSGISKYMEDQDLRWDITIPALKILTRRSSDKSKEKLFEELNNETKEELALRGIKLGQNFCEAPPPLPELEDFQAFLDYV